MIRNLKVLGLALVAVFAMASVSASAASAAGGTLTSDGPFYLLGTDELLGDSFTYPGEEPIICFGSHFKGEKVGANEPIVNDSSTITVTPTYTNCAAGSLPVTVTMNGCDYVYHIGETTGFSKTYGLTADIECSGENKVEIELYSGAAEGLKLCTIKFGTQTGLSGATIEEFSANLLVIWGGLTGISATKSGLCGSGSTNAASYDVNFNLSGYQTNGATPTTVSLSHG